MLLLENVLGELNARANVCVKLNSHTVYGIGETDEPHIMQDSCGNHHTMNWLDAMADKDLFNKFLVADVKCEFESYMDEPQWIITLANGKNECTDLLDYQSNKRACMASGLYI